nr:MAG TPA: ADP-ribosyltransferase exoenzyme [Caudoviricetes sp.]
MASLIFKDAEAAKAAIMASQQKEIAKLYEDWADEIGERAKYYSHKSTASAPVSERYYRELQKQLRQTSQEVSNEIYKKIKSNIYTVADAVVSDNVKWLESFGFSSAGLNAAFSYVPHEIVQNLVTGQIYDSGWSLSSRIWGDNEQTLKDIYQVMAKGLAENKPIYEIAKDLESYVRPSAKLPWNLRMADGKKIYKKQVDYNAQRLARTLVQHGYQQSFIATTQKNPFITEYIWRSNGSRVCDLCKARDGVHYKKTELPMDHPNGMCTMEPVVADDMIDQLADWFNSPDGTYPEIDAFAGNFGYQASKTGTVQDFIAKYGMSSKSPSSWFNSLTQIQKAEAKALKDQSGLTWNEWYEKNIYKGDGSNLGGKKKIQAFSDVQEKYLKPYGFTKDKMPYDFDDWSHKVSYEQASEILKSMGTSWSDPHPYQQLMKFYNQHLTDKNFVMKTATTTKKVASTTKTVGTQFDSAVWRETMRKQNLRTMESWCDDWLATLTGTQKSAVVSYTGSAYEAMNDYLRANGAYDASDRTKQLIKQCQAALKKASLPEEVIVHRGSGYNMLKELGLDISEANKDKLVGGIVQDLGFLSTSPDPSGGFSSGIEYVIKIPEGSQAMYVAPISQFHSERELLVNCGGKFMVDDVEFDSYGDVKRIYMTLKNLKGPK